MYMVITDCDFKALKKRYKTNAIQRQATYTYNFLPLTDNEARHEKQHIMVGHSATPTCCHLETFKMLKSYTGKIKIFCPLSYPDDKKYIQQVTEAGSELFGNDFVPLTEFMSYDKYVEFLNDMDIGIFNNNRQQGMGNITNLLYLGKKFIFLGIIQSRKYILNQITIFSQWMKF